jgi:hypothetical protein
VTRTVVGGETNLPFSLADKAFHVTACGQASCHFLSSDRNSQKDMGCSGGDLLGVSLRALSCFSCLKRKSDKINHLPMFKTCFNDQVTHLIIHNSALIFICNTETINLMNGMKVV